MCLAIMCHYPAGSSFGEGTLILAATNTSCQSVQKTVRKAWVSLQALPGPWWRATGCLWLPQSPALQLVPLFSLKDSPWCRTRCQRPLPNLTDAHWRIHCFYIYSVACCSLLLILSCWREQTSVSLQKYAHQILSKMHIAQQKSRSGSWERKSGSEAVFLVKKKIIIWMILVLVK